jgi:hypothetical protein
LALQPILWQGADFSATEAAARAFGFFARIGLLAIQAGQDFVHLFQRFDSGKVGAELTTDRIPLEIPSDMLTDVSASVVFVLKELDQ